MKTWLSIPGPTRRLGTNLLDQQLWLFGCDIRRDEGNLLLDYGFTRTRASEGVKASSQYQKDNVFLWGFGIHYAIGAGEGLFLQRYQFRPMLAATPDADWHAQAGSRMLETSDDCQLIRQHLPDLLRWMATYEAWILDAVGSSYRQRCLAAWPKRCVTDADEIPVAWQNLAAQCAHLPERTRNLSPIRA